MIKKKKLKNEKKNHGVKFCAIEYYSHTCGLYIYIYIKECNYYKNDYCDLLIILIIKN